MGSNIIRDNNISFAGLITGSTLLGQPYLAGSMPVAYSEMQSPS